MGVSILRFNYQDTGTNDGTTYHYTRYSNYPEPGRGQIISNGSTTTITGTDVTSGIGTYSPLNIISAGDILVARYGLGDGAEYVRKVATKVSASEITVASAVDFTNGTTAWSFFQKKSGTTATDGQHLVQNFKKKSLVINVGTLGSAALNFRLEGRSGSATDSSWTPIWTQAVSAVGSVYFPINEPWVVLRLGEYATTPGTDLFDAYVLCEEN